MKNPLRSLWRGICLITISLMSLNNLWLFDPHFGTSFLLCVGVLHIMDSFLDHFGLLQKEGGRWVWKSKRKE